MLEISEIFGPTVQGEGKRVGRVSIFIRFSKCNFTCSGFEVAYINEEGQEKLGCDTYYAVDSSFKKQWKILSSKEIIKEVTTLANNKPFDIVISGGEPLLFWQKDEFQEILEYFILNKHHITIETNASLNINFTKEYQKEILFSMSVKLANSNEAYKKRVNISALNTILENTKESYLKFVINKETKDEAIKEIKEIREQLAFTEVYLMPMAKNIDELSQNDKSIIDLCIENNYIYCDRTHIRIWNDKKGV